MQYRSTRSWVVSFALFAAALLIPATAQAQLIERKVTADDGAASDFFGWSVAIDGGVAIVGAQLTDGAGIDSNSGSAYLIDVITGSQIGMPLTAPDASNPATPPPRAETAGTRPRDSPSARGS